VPKYLLPNQNWFFSLSFSTIVLKCKDCELKINGNTFQSILQISTGKWTEKWLFWMFLIIWFPKIGGRKRREVRQRIWWFFHTLFQRCQDGQGLIPALNTNYIIFRELFDELSAEATWSSYHFTWEFSDNVDLLELPAATLNHFDDGSALRTNTSDGPFDIASSVVFSICAENAGADSKFGVGTVGTGSRLMSQVVHFFELEISGHVDI
jgi:hypothetical protein